MSKGGLTKSESRIVLPYISEVNPIRAIYIDRLMSLLPLTQSNLAFIRTHLSMHTIIDWINKELLSWMFERR
jgi:hypothetical protein